MLFMMQKEIIEGIPFWKDKSNNLYNFESDKKNLFQIGTYNSETQTYTLKDNWRDLYSEKLDNYRKNLSERDRKENKVK